MNSKIVKIFEVFISIFITLGFIYLFFTTIGIKKFISFFKSIDFVNLVFAIILYLFSYILRTIRWKITLPIKNFFKLFKITVYNTVFNIFLPFRTGELSFFYMLKKENVELSKSSISFFTVRFFDAYTLITFFIFSYLLIKNYILALIFLIISPLGIFFAKFLANFLKFKQFQEFKNQTLNNKNILTLYFLSFFTLFTKFSAFFLILPKSLNLNYPSILFASSAGDLTTVLPIHGIAGIGTYEGGFAGILLTLKIDTETAILASVFVHIFILVSSALIALITKVISIYLKA